MDISELYKIIYKAEQASYGILVAAVVNRMHNKNCKKRQFQWLHSALNDYAANGMSFNPRQLHTTSTARNDITTLYLKILYSQISNDFNCSIDLHTTLPTRFTECAKANDDTHAF